MDSTLPHFKDSRSPVRDDIFIVIDTLFFVSPVRGDMCMSLIQSFAPITIARSPFVVAPYFAAFRLTTAHKK